ncbi:MAG: hypothetical protein GXO25_01445, partial [Euryarchaeota archaeon]|nr:hypothetical protein [Euryarchaeota archaeon]
MGAHPHGKLIDHGYFKGRIFYNGHIKYVIHGLHARIFNAHGGMYVRDVHPEILVHLNKWKRIKFVNISEEEYSANGTHFVVVEAEHHGVVYAHISIMYRQKVNFSLYEPLYPRMWLTFNSSVEYRIIWKIDGIHIPRLMIKDNGTGYTEPPFRHGHMKRVLFNGTVRKNMVFRDWQDIMIGYEGGKKRFGFNWEVSKERFRVLKLSRVRDGVNAEVSTEPQESDAYQSYTFNPPTPDTGGGGGSGGGGSTPQDSDHDGLSDNTEVAGWYVYWYDSSGRYHWKHVTSDPNKPDTDGDGLNDSMEYKYQLDPRNKDTDGDGMSDYYEVHYGKPAGGWQEPHYYNHRYAVIIVGGGYDSNTFYPAFWNDGKAMYDKLVN